MVIRGYSFSEFDNPWDLPVAVLKNGAIIWEEEKLSSLSYDVIAGRPRLIAQENYEKKMNASHEEVIYETPSVIREFRIRGRVSKVSYIAKVREYSNNTFEGVVEDKLGNVLFPFTASTESEIYEVIERDMYGWIEENC